MKTGYIILVLGWGLYFFLHSFLAAIASKNFIRRHLPVLSKGYRVFYNILAGLGLLAMLLVNASIPSDFLLRPGGVVRFWSYVLAAFGVIVIRQSFKRYSIREFMLGAKDGGGSDFITTGILRYVRHPIYSGTILIAIGFWLFTPNITTLISVLCILAYLAIGIFLEEKKLISEFGEKYKNYKKEVPMLIPRITLFGRMLSKTLPLFLLQEM